MGTFKKESSRKTRQGKTGHGLDNVKIKGENFYRTAKQAKQLKIEKSGKAQRNAAGQITQAAAYQSRSIPDARIEPNRKWFSNSRVISQDSLAAFRQAMSEKKADPYSVLLRTNKLPLSLVEKEKENGVEKHQAKMAIEASPFDTTFGPKSQRKRVKLDAGSFEDLARDVNQRLDSSIYPLDPDPNVGADDGLLSSAVEPIFKKGQSKRIWNELYRVIDSSDVLIQVLDARDPQGTRCESVEKYIRTEAPHKHLIFVVNKVDLVPTRIAASWVRRLSKERPTLALHASMQHPFGKGSLINMLRQFAVLHKDRKQISVGIIGYPNVGKSSIVNMLRGKKVAVVAPIPGATKVWQYVTLWKDTYLIDCPGIVPAAKQDTPEELLLRGVVRVENVEYPEQYIPTLLSRVKQHHLERTYNLQGGWTDHIHLLEQLARKGGRLLPGGEPDVSAVAKMIINDFLRGKLPWYTPPPPTSKGGEGDAGNTGSCSQGAAQECQQDDDDATDASAEEGAEEIFEGFSPSA